MKRFGLVGSKTRDFLTYNGKVIVHSDRDELEFLVPTHKGMVREVPPSMPVDQCLPIKFHPDFESVRWPLDRRQFRARY